MTDVKLTIQFGSAHFSAEGPEAFVTKMLEQWQQITPKGADKLSNAEQSAKGASSSQADSSSGVGKYENVYDYVDGKVKIIAHINGANKAEKTRATALVLMFANYLNGQEVTSADAIREACSDQGCFDSSNFAAHLKALKEKVAMNPKPGGGYDVKLTAPGRKAAQNLVETLNHAAE